MNFLSLRLRDVAFERALVVSSVFGMVYSCLYDGQVSEAVGPNAACVETLPSMAGPHGDVQQQSQSNSPKSQSEVRMFIFVWRNISLAMHRKHFHASVQDV